MAGKAKPFGRFAFLQVCVISGSYPWMLDVWVGSIGKNSNATLVREQTQHDYCSKFLLRALHAVLISLRYLPLKNEAHVYLLHNA